MNKDYIIDLNEIKEKYLLAKTRISKRIVICAGTGCVANNSLGVYDEFLKRLNDKNLDVVTELKYEDDKEHNGADKLHHISTSGCQGFCQMGPLVTIYPEEILYTRVKPEHVDEIIDETIINNRLVEKLLYKDLNSDKLCENKNQIDFYNRQSRYILKECGVIDPQSLEEYIAKDGYRAAYRAVHDMEGIDICKEIIDSNMRGRGGGGFLTGKKWELTRVEKNNKKYIICNGDEGDPGAFMDRSLMEGNPHAVIEGMIISAMGVGADEGYVYVRTEYPLAVKRMINACEVLRKNGILGKNIFGSTKNFDLTVMQGAGAFVCGEETAMIASIEGKRGMPDPKPPYPSQKGLFGKPTVINNVETFATIPNIILYGSKNFKAMGTATSSGTKTFALTGHVVNTGLIEVPFGTTLRQIVREIAGGVVDNNGNLQDINFKAIQIGGPSGGCLTKEHLDLPIDYESLKAQGAMVGSGGLVVMNHDTCMVKIAHYFMQFTQNESCGKCVLCREGTKQMLMLLEDIIEGRATLDTIALLKELCENVEKGSLCGLGKTAPKPVLSTLKYFYDEYIAHIVDKKCPAGECTSLMSYKVMADKCKGCTLCAKKCPVNAISGEIKKAHYIDDEKCIKCGVCKETCKFNAISLV